MTPEILRDKIIELSKERIKAGWRGDREAFERLDDELIRVTHELMKAEGEGLGDLPRAGASQSVGGS